MAALHGLAQSKQKRRAKFREPDPLQLPPLQLGHCHVGPTRAGPTRSDSTARRPTAAAEPRPNFEGRRRCNSHSFTVSKKNPTEDGYS